MTREVLLQKLKNIHDGRPTAPGGDQAIVVADIRPPPVADPPKTAGIRTSSSCRQRRRQTRQADPASPQS
jgi:hypothetical protein